MKSTLKRFLSLVLCMCMAFALLPNVTVTAFAATSGTVTGLADENIGLSFTGSADDAWTASGTTITGSATSTGGTCGDTAYNSTLEITNKKSATATLSFDYAIEQNSGTIQVAGTEVSSGASFTKELAANETVKVYIKSGSTSAATKITLTNVALVSNVTATATFLPAENGAYTVDGKTVTEEYSNTQSSMTAYKVEATPAEGYQFLGWYNLTTGKCIATTAAASLNIESDCTITAKFVSKAAALFETGGQRFADLNEAVAYARANKQSKITLATDGSISGTYTIPAGITLLIPFDAAGTLYTDAPAAIRTTPASKPFRTLTMSEGTSITVNGAISLGGRYFAAAGSQQGRPVGDYGYIKMADNSSITVKNGGNLYAWGFISGSGSVLAESGATVYEFYQIADFRGGSASSAMGNKVFPFSQYFVQNIEVPLTLNAGANEIVFSGVYAMSSTYTTSINFIGDNGMFKVVSGSFTKDYDEKTDRLILTVNGEAQLNTLALKLAGMSVNSASYVLPITNNISINIQSGGVTIGQDTALLAGVEVSIAQGADLTVSSGKNVYIYDSDEWNSDNFVWGPCKFKSVAYAPGKAYSRSNNDLVDAKVDVNGSLTAIGAIYTTKGGADICSSNGTGQYAQQGMPGTETATYQYNADGNNAVTIPITPAKLHNADGSYTETATVVAGITIPYVSGVWGGTAKATITFDPNGGTGTMPTMEVRPGTKISLSPNGFTREGYSFTGWNTAADGTGKAYVDKQEITVTGDITLYAQWTQNPVITFDANGGEGTMAAQTVEPNKAADLIANTFTRADYDFAGWNTEADGTGTAYADKANITVGENTTLYAQWTLHKYHVRWLNWDGSILREGYYTCEDAENGEVYYMDAPERPEDDNYTYKFRGWDPANGTMPMEIHADTDYTAQYNKFEKLTVTFVANGGTGTMETVKIANGNSGTSYTLPECGFTRPGYTFDGWLITGTVGYNAYEKEELQDGKWDDTRLLAFSNLILKASWKVNSYTVTWKNYDGTELATTAVEYGKVPAYTGDTPTHPEEQHYTYKFAGWSPELSAVTSDVTYTAQFEKIGKNGLCQEGSDTYWLENGKHVMDKGLTQVKDAEGHNLYYYFGADGKAVKNVPEGGQDFWISAEKANGLLPEWGYYFDENGIIFHDSQFQNGIVDGYYYIDGIKVHMGMFKQGDDYYYAKSDGQLITGKTYYCQRNNGLLPDGYYTFDDTGKMIDPPKQDLKKNGIVSEDGSLYYYENGFRTYAGLIKIGDDYYYVRTGGEVVHGRSYWITKTNGLMAERSYKFAEDGKMIDPEIKKDPNVNGIVSENSSLYYYENGLRTYAGLIEIDGSYYYVKTDGEVVHGRSYWISKTNGLMAEGSYTFDADGKMTNPVLRDNTKNGIVAENGSLYYYQDGLRTYAGLIEINGSYYYVRTSGEVVHGQKYWITKTNGLMAEGGYTFADDGKMIIR